MMFTSEENIFFSETFLVHCWLPGYGSAEPRHDERTIKEQCPRSVQIRCLNNIQGMALKEKIDMVERFKVGNFCFSRDHIIEGTNANHRMGNDTETHMYLIIT